MDNKPVLYSQNKKKFFSEKDLEECKKNIELRNLIYFLYGENVFLDEELEKEIKKCEPLKEKNHNYYAQKISKIKKKMGKKHLKNKNKIILSFNCPEKHKDKALKITFDGYTLYAYEESV